MLIAFGMYMPWVRFDFDIQVISLDTPPLAGWEHFLALWQEVIHRFRETGFELFMLPFWLMASSSILMVLYLIFNLLVLLGNRDHKSIKSISILLLVVVAILSIPVFFGGKPFAGYWLANLGIFSSAILEWQKGDIQIG